MVMYAFLWWWWCTASHCVRNAISVAMNGKALQHSCRNSGRDRSEECSVRLEGHVVLSRENCCTRLGFLATISGNQAPVSGEK